MAVDAGARTDDQRGRGGETLQGFDGACSVAFGPKRPDALDRFLGAGAARTGRAADVDIGEASMLEKRRRDGFVVVDRMELGRHSTTRGPTSDLDELRFVGATLEHRE